MPTTAPPSRPAGPPVVTGPPGRWLTGNLADFRRDWLAFLYSAAQTYGDVVALRFGPRRLYLMSHPDLIEEVLVGQHRNFRKHYGLRLARYTLGNGLLLSEGDFWRRQRRLAQPAFHHERISGYATEMVARTQRQIASWREGDRRDLHAEMMHLTLDIVASTLFGAEVTDSAALVERDLSFILRDFNQRLNSPILVPIWWPLPRNFRLRRAIAQLDRVLYRLIAERRATAATRTDLLSLLLAARDQDDGTGMTDRQLRDEAMTIFLAGHETTAIALSWTWYLLAQHPAVAARLYAELDNVLADQDPTVADLPALRYTEQVILEAMRLYPPAYVIGREAVQDTVVGGYPLRKGETVLMSQWVVHRDPRYFEEPLAFRPERWADDLARRLPRYAYFPFGGGPRICIGNSFAQMEAMLILATIARRFHLERATAEPVVPEPTITLRPRGGVPMIVRVRKPSAQ